DARMELGIGPHESTLMEVSSTHLDAYPLHPHQTAENNTPDVLTVQVQTDAGGVQELLVEVERPGHRKKFLGGYRHQLTGVEFHHAAVQTLQKKRPDRGVEAFSRDTQTVELSRQEQQLWGRRLHPDDQGRFATSPVAATGWFSPGTYTTASEYLERRLRAVICLQAFVRRWLAHKAATLRMERDRRLAWSWSATAARSNPQRREDFNQLYRSVARWRMEVEQQICSTLTGAEKTAVLRSLVQFETEQIAAIERRQIAIGASNHDNSVRRLLDKTAACYRWPAAGGQTVLVENQQILRARHLRDVYASVSLRPRSPEQRERALERLRDTLQEHACQLTDDITGLLDRELDLMRRSVGGASLDGLRKRISTLVLQFVKTPEFNPEVSRHLQPPQTTSQSQSDTLLCRSCHRFQPASRFDLPAGCRRISRCRACSALDHVSRARRDVCSYKKLLLRLRAEEQQLGGDATITFLLQAEDLRYLVEDVWTFCPAKESSHLDGLDLVRWDRRRAWSPWNCFLLPREESSSHLQVEDLQQVYEAVFIRSVEYKHLVAWRHFSQNPAMVDYL
uniref:IQ motif and ubiquitin domain containing n=1 Tax=Tetraodon nigroviridis TaxID=99883 RepID=H3CYI3_TETNG